MSGETKNIRSQRVSALQALLAVVLITAGACMYEVRLGLVVCGCLLLLDKWLDNLKHENAKDTK